MENTRQDQAQKEAYLLAHKLPTGKLGRQVAESMNQHHKPLRDWGLTQVSFPEGACLLEAACGGGMTAHDLLRNKKLEFLAGFDLSEEMAGFARNINRQANQAGRAAFLQADVSSLPFPDRYFDGALAFETIYFWPDLLQGLQEIKRALKPKAQLLIVNELYRYRGLTDREKEVISLLKMEVLTCAEYRDRVANAGFEKIKIVTHPDFPWIAIRAQTR